MTADDFRELALAFPGVVEGAHMRHPDFRAHGKIFATLAYPSDEFGMVKIEPADQKRLVELHGQMFVPVKGAWGLQGCTSVRLAAAQRDVVSQALDMAWQKSVDEAAKPKLAKKTPSKKSAKKVSVKKAVKKTKRSELV
jgi:hypothetical protein